MIDRMFRAAQLERGLYEEVEADQRLTTEALLVVVIGAVASGIGLGLAAEPLAIILGTLVALLAWAIYAGLAYYVGTRILAEAETHADWGQVLRTVGYANAPQALLVTIFIPVIGPIIALIVSVWVLWATVIAVRQALDYTSTWRAIGVSLIAWVGQVVIISLVFVAAT